MRFEGKKGEDGLSIKGDGKLYKSDVRWKLVNWIRKQVDVIYSRIAPSGKKWCMEKGAKSKNANATRKWSGGMREVQRGKRREKYNLLEKGQSLEENSEKNEAGEPAILVSWIVRIGKLR